MSSLTKLLTTIQHPYITPGLYTFRLIHTYAYLYILMHTYSYHYIKLDYCQRILQFSDMMLHNYDIFRQTYLLLGVHKPAMIKPCRFSVTMASFNQSGAHVSRPFHTSGSLRDLLCASKPKSPFFKKYMGQS